MKAVRCRSVPLRRAAALSVIRNPYAGSYVQDIASFMDDLKPIGIDMAYSLIAALGGEVKAIEGYGKGAIVGVGWRDRARRIVACSRRIRDA